jgi:carbonic anhydrase
MDSQTPRIDRLLESHQRVAYQLPDDAGPVPRTEVAIVTCMDARIDPFREFGLEPGDAHVIRTAGATVTEDVLRSLVASQWALGTREVLILGHSGCGMAGFDEAEFRRTQRETGADAPPFPMRGFEDMAENVRYGVAAVAGATFLHPDTAVRGVIYHLDSGSLEPVD